MTSVLVEMLAKAAITERGIAVLAVGSGSGARTAPSACETRVGTDVSGKAHMHVLHMHVLHMYVLHMHVLHRSKR